MAPCPANGLDLRMALFCSVLPVRIMLYLRLNCAVTSVVVVVSFIAFRTLNGGSFAVSDISLMYFPTIYEPSKFYLTRARLGYSVERARLGGKGGADSAPPGASPTGGSGVS